jgi:hypothetical protein
VLTLTEADPDRRPTAHAALSHQWLKMQHVHESPKSNPVSPNAAIPVTTPAQGISHTLMQRMNEQARDSIGSQVRPEV